jgi:hypothetical protein
MGNSKMFLKSDPAQCLPFGGSITELQNYVLEWHLLEKGSKDGSCMLKNFQAIQIFISRIPDLQFLLMDAIGTAAQDVVIFQKCDLGFGRKK